MKNKKQKKNDKDIIREFEKRKKEEADKFQAIKDKYSYFTLGKKIEYLGIKMIVGFINITPEEQFIVGDSVIDGVLHYERLDSNRMDIILQNLKK